MNKFSFNALEYIDNDLSLVEEAMRQSQKDSHPDIEAALNHLLDAGGKRIRPALVILFGRMFHAPSDRSITMAAAIELLHNATLVHDDFIDGSLLRRGIPTLNSHWSAGATVLTGDYIFAKAAYLASESGTIDQMRLFARALMTIVVGEVSQLFSQNGNSLQTSYYDRIHAKTAALFELACEIGAQLGSVPEELLSGIRLYGNNIGAAFQIVDDILDFSSASETIGKPVGGDLRRGIITLPAIYYFEDHPKVSAVNAVLGRIPLPEEEMTALINSIRNSNAMIRTHERAHELIQAGIQALNPMPAGQEKDTLIELAEFIAARSL